MQIVIDIDEKNYKSVMLTQNRPIGQRLPYGLSETIKNGTILPKGHGRLIDADAFIAILEDASKRHKYKELLIDDCLTVDDVFKAVIESLQNKGLAEGDAPTVLEPSDNPTNGDMIMTMFPNAIYQDGFLYKIVNGKQYVFMSVTEHWWNAHYESEDN